MLVRADGVQIPQPAHAWLAGRLAAAWARRPPELVPLWDELVQATAIHDLGWLPYDTQDREPFFRTPPSVSIGLWRAGLEHAQTFGALAGLLVSLHASRIFAFQRSSPPALEAGVEPFLAAEAERQTLLRERSGVAPEVVAGLSDALWAFDRLSLICCHGTDAPADLTGAPWDASGAVDLHVEQDGYPDGPLRLDPWPFAGEALELTVSARDRDVAIALRAQAAPRARPT